MATKIIIAVIVIIAVLVGILLSPLIVVGIILTLPVLLIVLLWKIIAKNRHDAIAIHPRRRSEPNLKNIVPNPVAITNKGLIWCLKFEHTITKVDIEEHKRNLSGKNYFSDATIRTNLRNPLGLRKFIIERVGKGDKFAIISLNSDRENIELYLSALLGANWRTYISTIECNEINPLRKRTPGYGINGYIEDAVQNTLPSGKISVINTGWKKQVIVVDYDETNIEIAIKDGYQAYRVPIDQEIARNLRLSGLIEDDLDPDEYYIGNEHDYIPMLHQFCPPEELAKDSSPTSGSTNESPMSKLKSQEFNPQLQPDFSQGLL